MVESKQQDWIYESPDGGETVYRRRAGSLEREQVDVGEHSSTRKSRYEDTMWAYRNEWDELADRHPAIKEYLDKLIATIKLIEE